MGYLKTQYAVSVNPKFHNYGSNGGYEAFDTIHENVRRSVSGDGEITGADGVATISGGWNNGNSTKYTSDGSTVQVTTSTNLLFIRHTGFLRNTNTKCDSIDLLQIKIDTSYSPCTGSDFILCELGPGEAMVFPRPGSSWGLIFSSSRADIDVEMLEIGT